MKKPGTIPFSTSAVLVLAEIKAAVRAFDEGETNAFAAVDAVIVAVEAYRTAMLHELKRPRRGAA